MNNVTSIDLEYNFNNLRNMVLLNKAKLLEFSYVRRTDFKTRDVTTEDYNWLNTIIENELKSIITVTIEAAQLEIDIATPHIPPSMPFVTDYVEYRRYETIDDEAVNQYFNDQTKTREIESGIYGLSYMPRSIYIWVASQDSTIYGSNQRCSLNNSYAQIMACEVGYGNLSKIGNHYTEKDLYLMALRNGLEYRPYVDWIRAGKCCYQCGWY